LTPNPPITGLQQPASRAAAIRLLATLGVAFNNWALPSSNRKIPDDIPQKRHVQKLNVRNIVVTYSILGISGKGNWKYG